MDLNIKIMTQLSVIKNTVVQDDNVLVKFFGKQEASDLGPISTAAKQVTFFMWCKGEIAKGTEFSFEVLKREGKRMSKILLTAIAEGIDYHCDVLYDTRPMVDEETGEEFDVTLKYLEVTDSRATDSAGEGTDM